MPRKKSSKSKQGEKGPKTLSDYLNEQLAIEVTNIDDFSHLFSKATEDDLIYAWIAKTRTDGEVYACYETIEDVENILNNGGLITIDEDPQLGPYILLKAVPMSR